MSLEQLIAILVELRQASISITTSSELHAAMDKYDMMFLGKNFNNIYSIELRHSLSKCFGINVSNDELNSLIPVACKSLGMKITPMAAIDDLQNPKAVCYQIALW